MLSWLREMIGETILNSFQENLGWWIGGIMVLATILHTIYYRNGSFGLYLFIRRLTHEKDKEGD